MQIKTELDDQHYEKLQQLQKIMGKNLTALLELAIDDLYARPKVSIGHDALMILRENHFIGCLPGEGNLSQNYKQELDWNHKL